MFALIERDISSISNPHLKKMKLITSGLKECLLSFANYKPDILDENDGDEHSRNQIQLTQE